MEEQSIDATQPLPSEPADGAAKKSSRTAVIALVSLVVAATLGAGAYVGYQLLGGGSQPAEALPSTVIAYAAVDLDPGAGQKIEAIKALRRFPELRRLLKVKERDDLRKKIFTEAIEGSECENKVDFDDDVAGWLGNRVALAAADLGQDEPSPVLALQVSDADDAAGAIERLRECGAFGKSDDFGYAFNENYLVISDSTANAERLVADAGRKTLADDERFVRWSEEAGGDGIASFYVSKRAAELALDAAGSQIAGQGGDNEALESALKDFEGMAGAVRFADAGLEIEIAAQAGREIVGDDGLGDALVELPDDTAVAVGFTVPDDFAQTLTDQLRSAFAGLADSLLADVEEQSGLTLPQDLETLLGEAIVMSLGGEAPDDLAGVSEPSQVPFGVKIAGDGTEIEQVLAKAEARAGTTLAEAGVVTARDGETYLLASSEEYAEKLQKSGSLGDADRFSSVVPEADDAAFALYVDFDSAWRKSIAQAMADSGASEEDQALFTKNSEPLGALGISAWRDGKVSHGLIKLTTD